MRKALLAELEAFDHSLERHLEGAKQQLREQVAELSQAASTADPADFQRALDLQRTIEELAVRLTLFRQGTDAGIADLSRLARRLRKGARKIKPPL
jgi:DNA-binding GntR family transcriptional regulator